MQRVLLVFISLLLTSSLAMAQLSLSQTVMNRYDMALGANTEVETFITNNSSNTITVRWERTEDIISDWQSFVCDKVLCYLPNKDFAEFQMEPGETTYFKVTLVPGSDGSGSVSVDLFDVDNPTTDRVNFTYYGSTLSSSIKGVTEKKSYSIFPNPANDEFSLKGLNSDIQSISIFSIVGREVKTFARPVDGQKFNVSDLPRGMYLVRLTGKNDTLIRTLRLNKR